MPSPARKAINKYLEEFAPDNQGKTLFVGVNYQWDKHYRSLFKNYQTIDVVKNVIEPDIYGDIMECWGIKDRSYDTVIMVGIWEILHSPQCAVEQIKRILKPGGKLVFGFPGEDFHLLVPTYTIPHVMSIIEPFLTILKIEGVTYKTDLPIYILGVAKK